MTDKRPTKRFQFSSRATSNDGENRSRENTRDKDNAQPRIKPPANANKPAPRLAPPGMSGIKGKQSKSTPAKEPPKKRFTLGKRGDLERSFRSVVKDSQSKRHDLDR
ncbi:MAG: hypothetical protein QNJ16_06175 [Rhodobacter sp.]|nr:hypothetical protein [Rhodobacter sp.]